MGEWIRKLCTHTHTHTHTMEYYSGIKSEVLPFVIICMGLEGIILSDISHIEKYRYCMISLICGI